VKTKALEVKGLISVDGNHYFTCCESRPKVLIDGNYLHRWLIEQSQLPPMPGDDDKHQPGKIEWQIRYVVRNQPWSSEDDFDTVVAEIVTTSLESDAITGCYYESSCGTGEYDFVLNGKHSILTELASHQGKYVWIRFNKQ
jgi:hypothetical protein